MDEAGLCFPTQRESFQLQINFSKAPGGPGRGGKGARHMASSSSLPQAGEQHYGYLESLLATCRHPRIPTMETPQMEPSSTGSPAGLRSLPQPAVPQGGLYGGLGSAASPPLPPSRASPARGIPSPALSLSQQLSRLPEMLQLPSQGSCWCWQEFNRKQRES